MTEDVTQKLCPDAKDNSKKLPSKTVYDVQSRHNKIYNINIRTIYKNKNSPTQSRKATEQDTTVFFWTLRPTAGKKIRIPKRTGHLDIHKVEII